MLQLLTLREKGKTIPVKSESDLGDSLKRPAPEKFFIYILECCDKSLYVGCTNNLEKRLFQHNNSKSGAHYTKIRRPVILKYSEELQTLQQARKRESEIKRWRREKKLKLFNK